MTFGYDLRKRLISEIRQVGQQIAYNYEYEYDQLGNRRCEHDLVNSRMTGYVYDVDWDPETPAWRAGLCYTPPADPNEADFPRNLEDFPTFQNRLLEYRVFDVSGETAVLLRTVRYAYWAYGHARNITIKDEWTGQGEPPAAYAKEYDLSLAYRTSGPLYMAIWGEYAGGYPTGYASSEAWEFRYDGGRERYLARKWDASDADPNNWVVDASVPATWTDYLGESPAVDYTVAGSPPAATPVRRYLAGYGVHAQADSADEFEPVYLHGDLIRSTVMMTDAGGQALATTAYTAFGEPISEGGVGVPPANFDTRYGYAGGWGYESGLISLQGANTELPPLTLQHVGARWYQPGIGRFVQRDPIGIRGGLNVYSYCDGEPSSGVDPRGLQGIPVGQPSSTNPTPYPVPAGGRHRITWHPRPPIPPRPAVPPWLKKPTLVTMTFCAAYWAGTELVEHTPTADWIAQGLTGRDDGGVPMRDPGAILCLVGGTAIETSRGSAPIEELVIGDWVFARSELGDSTCAWDALPGPADTVGRVISIRVGYATEWIALDLGTEILECTESHPIWVVSRGWTSASDIRAGEALLDSEGKYVPVRSVECRGAETPIRVFSVTVTDARCYYAGKTKVLVHNKPR